jgi:glutamate dehydrogenase (NAD(P)+)
VAVQDHRGAIYNPDGIDSKSLMKYTKKQKTVSGYPEAEAVAAEEFWGLPVDIMIPAALEGQINEKNAKLIKAKVVVEGANGPATEEGEKVLKEKNIPVLPDLLANSGGVTVSYFEWVQNKTSAQWSLPEVDQKLSYIMRKAFHRTYEAAKEYDCDFRTAAYVVALNKIERAYQERGIFP